MEENIKEPYVIKPNKPKTIKPIPKPREKKIVEVEKPKPVLTLDVEYRTCLKCTHQKECKYLQVFVDCKKQFSALCGKDCKWPVETWFLASSCNHFDPIKIGFDGR